MLSMAVLVILGLLSPSTSFTVRDFLKDAVKGTWSSAPPNGATIFFCTKELWTVLKDVSGLDFTVRLAQPPYWLDVVEFVRTASPQGLHTLIVDWQCPLANQLLRKASKLAIIRSPYRWLVLNVTEEEQTQESCQDLASEISANGSALAEGKAADADVVLVCRGANSLILVDLWGPVAPVILGKWPSDLENRPQGGRSSPAARRIDVGFNGYVFRTAFVITNNESLKHLTDGDQKGIDYLSKSTYEVCHVVAKMLNSTVEDSFVQDLGYKINGSWTGMIGQQLRGEAEIGGSAATMSYVRVPVTTFLNYGTPAQVIFIFKEPPMSYIYDIFTLPFTLSLWLCIIGLILLTAVLLYGVMRVESAEKRHDEPADVKPPSWSDIALLTVGAVCQTGTPIAARGVSGRIVTFCMFLSFLFFYTAYSASIVALLQSTTSNINHFKDFLDSRIKLGVHNTSYNNYYIKANNDTYRRRIYLEKLTVHGRYNPYMSLEEGIKRMRSSYFAFLGGKYGIHQTIADTFQEYEKCGLREVDKFLDISSLHLTVSKWSTFTEVLRITLRKVQERGIRHRQLQKSTPMKPVCMKTGGNAHNVSLTDCYAAFACLFIGLGISFFLFLAENFVPRFLKRINKIEPA